MCTITHPRDPPDCTLINSSFGTRWTPPIRDAKSGRAGTPIRDAKSGRAETGRQVGTPSRDAKSGRQVGTRCTHSHTKTHTHTTTTQSGRAEPHSLIRDAIRDGLGGFYTGHHIYTYRCIYTYIYTFFDPFSDQFLPSTIQPSSHRTQHLYTRQHVDYHHKKKFFHTNSQFFTRFHKISPSKNTKKHQNPQNREKPEKTVFLGVPPHPPKNPYFPGFSGPPKLHKFAQICTNLHQFAPPKHHFWGVPNLPGPSG